MAAFLGDIAFLFGIVVATAGLFTLHRAAGDPRPLLLKIAAIVLLIAGTGTALCTSYYYLKYHLAGDLDHPFPISAGSMQMMMGVDTKGGPPRSVSPAARAPDASEEKHTAHHPETGDEGSDTDED